MSAIPLGTDIRGPLRRDGQSGTCLKDRMVKVQTTLVASAGFEPTHVPDIRGIASIQAPFTQASPPTSALNGQEGVPVGESYLGAAYLVRVQSVITQLSEFTGFIVDLLILPDPLVGEGFPPRSCASAALGKSYGGKGEW